MKLENMNPTEIKDRKLLAQFLGVTDSVLKECLVNGPRVISKTEIENEEKSILKSWVIKHFIPKRNPKFGFRVVYEAKSSLRNIHKSIYSLLSKIYEPSDVVHGFVSGRNICSNAKQHLAKNVVFCFDIKDFFEFINIESVVDVFSKFGFSKEVSRDLAVLCTLEGHLVQGYVTSPIIANIAAEQLDQKILDLISKSGATYTRYADDITISSNLDIPKIEFFHKIVEQCGFSINEQKIKFMFRGEKQYVTGLTVFDDVQPRISKKFKKKIRLILYFMKKFGRISFQLKKQGVTYREYEDNFDIRADIDDKIFWEDKRLKGWIDFINSVEPRIADVYYEEYNILKD
ncbi:MAG: reverse transcriptase family protein [Patescibacteria group bacterium]